MFTRDFTSLAASVLTLSVLSGMTVAGPPAPHDVSLRRVSDRADRPGGGNGGEGGVAGGCPPVIVAHSSSDFKPGEYVAQGGIIEGEILATAYEIPAEAFPIRIDLIETLFATSNAVVETTTVWAVHVWSGVPTSGPPVFSITSDGDILPHLVMPPGTTGANLSFLVDPDDVDQIWVSDDGSHTVTVGIEIVEHNQPASNQCVSPPSSQFNAFPCTDTDGLQVSNGNWIYIEDCGVFGCPPGWKRFSDLPSFCRPSGDWVQRLTWTPSACDELGACCIGGGCSTLDELTCVQSGGVWEGAGTTCSGVDCSETAPCCFAATGGCVQLVPGDCLLAGGTPGPIGEACEDFICFPEGACCLPDGSCTDGLSPEECAALNGTFQGDGTDCGTTDCPEPVGASCFATGFCLVLTEEEAIQAGATWQGTGTTCEDLDGDGTADACESTGIPGDLDGNDRVDGADLGLFLVGWGSPGATDLNGDGTTNGEDLGTLLVNWTG